MGHILVDTSISVICSLLSLLHTASSFRSLNLFCRSLALCRLILGLRYVYSYHLHMLSVRVSLEATSDSDRVLMMQYGTVGLSNADEHDFEWMKVLLQWMEISETHSSMLNNARELMVGHR